MYWLVMSQRINEQELWRGGIWFSVWKYGENIKVCVSLNHHFKFRKLHAVVALWADGAWLNLPTTCVLLGEDGSFAVRKCRSLQWSDRFSMYLQVYCTWPLVFMSSLQSPACTGTLPLQSPRTALLHWVAEPYLGANIINLYTAPVSFKLWMTQQTGWC